MITIIISSLYGEFPTDIIQFMSDQKIIADVYKRQSLFFAACSDDDDKSIPVPEPSRMITGIKAVSYTHLDVYKRQDSDYAV